MTSSTAMPQHPIPAAASLLQLLLPPTQSQVSVPRGVQHADRGGPTGVKRMRGKWIHTIRLQRAEPGYREKQVCRQEGGTLPTHTLLPCPALAELVPVGATPRDPEGDRDPRNGENWPQLGLSSQHGGGRAGPGVCAMCARMCVLHTPRSPPPFRYLYSLPATSLTSSPPNFNSLTQTNSSNLWEMLFPRAGGQGRRAGLQSPPAPLLQPAGPGASLAPAALSAGRVGMFTTSYRRPSCCLQ